jgi:chromosome partitioning protein
MARALAREAANNGLKVRIADLDTQQGTSVDWHRLRLNNGIEPAVSAEAYTTAAHALKLAKQFDLLIIDAPARTSKGTLDIARVAHLVVQPTGASVNDLRPAVREFHALVKEGIPRAKLTLALNRIGTPAEEAEARSYIAEAGYTALNGCLLGRKGLLRPVVVDFELSVFDLARQGNPVAQRVADGCWKGLSSTFLMPVRNAKTAKTTRLETIAVKDFEAALETNRLTFIRGDKLKGAGIRGSCLQRALRVS